MIVDNDMLDDLMWESIPSNDLLFSGSAVMTKENMNELPVEDVQQLFVSRDEELNIVIRCVSIVNQGTSRIIDIKKRESEYLPGMSVKPGEIVINYPGNSYRFCQCYFQGYTGNYQKIEYKLSCYHAEFKSKRGEKVALIREWILNGSRTGLRFCGNGKYDYTKESVISGNHGDLIFPEPRSILEKNVIGRYLHVKFKDTAFDVSFLGNKNGPQWSENICISYFENYGRIPRIDERECIREYLSFFIGKRLIYIGESSFDENGNIVGRIIEKPRTYNYDIKFLCSNGAKAPIKDEYADLNHYVDAIQQGIDRFDFLYKTYDLESFLSAYWYSKNVARPFDLVILGSALERLVNEWYSEEKNNHDTVLIEKKDFSKRIRPVKELIEKIFEDTGYVERMKRSVDSINIMSTSEKFQRFFEEIGLPIGGAEKKALKARNCPAHGSYRNNNEKEVKEMQNMSKVYECLINRIVLKLLDYNGNYVDYGTIGYPEKDISCPCGDVEMR